MRRDVVPRGVRRGGVDCCQVEALLNRIFWDDGLRFVFTTRSKTPAILGTDGKPLYGEGCAPAPAQSRVQMWAG